MKSSAAPLKVLSWRGRWGEAFERAVLSQFVEQTGISVKPVYRVGLRLPPELVTSLESGAPPPMDVVWCNTSPALRAAERDWCVPLQGLDVLDEMYKSAQLACQPQWPVAQAYVVPYVLVYRRALFPEGAPHTWAALLDPRHAGKVVFYPGGNGLYPIAQLLGGGQVDEIPGDLSACWSTVARLRSQCGRPDYSIGMGPLLERGDIDLCFRALPNALAFRADGLEVDWTVPEEGVSETTDSLWIPRGLQPEVQQHALRFVAFALSAEVQQHWCELLGALPMNRRAPAPGLFRTHPRLPDHADDRRGVLFVPEHVKARYELEWESRFDALISPD
jgi:putative spermidine/putrescine transport system substrate-binding protein